MSRRIVINLTRHERNRLRKVSRASSDAAHKARIQIILLYSDGWSSGPIAEAVGSVSSRASRTAHRYLEYGIDGLLDGRRSNGEAKVDDDLRQALAEIVNMEPKSFTWSRPTWTRELLSKALKRITGVQVSITTIGRMLKQLKARWGMPRQCVTCPWSKSRKTREIRKIKALISTLPYDEVAFYQDEVDVHLNPKIGRDWMLQGQQKHVETPGNNKKDYIAGALAVDGSDLIWVKGERKNTDLFIRFLKKIQTACPNAKRIHLILDNYVIHKSKKLQRYLEAYGERLALHFLPPYSPDHNKIERLWRELHANVTRNHTEQDMNALMRKVENYLRRNRNRRRKGESLVALRDAG